jgi:hypothetical protein
VSFNVLTYVVGIVGILTRLWAGQSGFTIPAVAGDFCLLQNVRVVLDPPSLLHGRCWGLFLGALSGWDVSLTTHLLSNTEFNECGYTATPSTCLHCMYRENFPFYAM